MTNVDAAVSSSINRFSHSSPGLIRSSKNTGVVPISRKRTKLRTTSRCVCEYDTKTDGAVIAGVPWTPADFTHCEFCPPADYTGQHATQAAPLDQCRR